MLGGGGVEAGSHRREYVVTTGLAHRRHRARPLVLSPLVLVVTLGPVRDGGVLVSQRLVDLGPEAALTHVVKCLRGVPVILREMGSQRLVVGKFLGGGIIFRHLDFLGVHKRFRLGICHVVDAIAVD